MDRSPARSLLPLGIVGLSLLAVPAHADSKDGQAKKLEQAAMDNDYLATNFVDAEKKLQQAIKLCAPKACSAQVRAHLYVSIGIVHGVGLNKLDQAKTDFVEALKTDATVKLDKDLSTPELQFTFDEAKAGAASAPATTPTGQKLLVHTTPQEQALETPVPLYVEMPSGTSAARVQLRYKAPGAADFKSLDMPPLGSGYGAEVPCGELKTQGDLEYYVLALDANDAVVVTGGSRATPYRVAIVDKLSAEAPHFPNKPPPASCAKKGPAGPPPLADDRTIVPPCDSDRECDEGMVCSEKHKCEAKPVAKDDDEDQPKTQAKKNWLSLQFVADISLVSGDDVCTESSQANDHFACFYSDKSQYHGNPVVGKADNISGGAVASTMRIVAGYDRLFGRNFTAGVRAGFAFNGGPQPDGASAFLPLHAEVRGGYYIGKDPFGRTGVRPFVFVAGGMMEVDSKVPIEVHELSGTGSCPGGATECKINLDAWRRAGNVFVGAGIGAQYAVSMGQALVIDVRASQLFPAPATVISPEIGFVTGF